MTRLPMPNGRPEPLRKPARSISDAVKLSARWAEWRGTDRPPDHAQPVRDAQAWHEAHQAGLSGFERLKRAGG